MKREYRTTTNTNRHMAMAKDFALANSLDARQKVACVIVTWLGDVLGIGANGSPHHAEHGCARVALGCKSGEGYDLCEGCHPKNHAEPSAIRDVLARGNKNQLIGSELYMWGHYWCCNACWDAIETVGIARVWLPEHARAMFDAASPVYVFGARP